MSKAKSIYNINKMLKLNKENLIINKSRYVQYYTDNYEEKKVKSLFYFKVAHKSKKIEENSC